MPSYTPGVIGAPRQPQPGGGPTTGGSGGGSTTTSGGGTQFNYDPRIGQGPLPPNQWGAANRAYVREPRQEEMASYHANQITSQNSPLMRNAFTGASQRSAARGGLNTSMAGEAAQKAVIETAMPMALQQAGAYGQAASENQQYLNQRDLANMEMENSMRQYESAQSTALMGNEFELQRQRERLAFEGEQSELGRQHNFGMAGLSNQFGQEQDYRRNQFDTDADYRRYQIQQGLNEQGFNYDQRSEDARYRRQATSASIGALLELFMNSPEEMDDVIGSGWMDLFSRFAEQGFGSIGQSIYGGGP